MKALSINLARRPFYNSTLYLVAYAVSAAMLIAMTTLNVFTFVADRMALTELGRAQSTLRQELDSLDREEARIRKSLQSARLVRLSTQSAFVQNAMLQRLFSWTDLFNQLERVLPPDVLLLSIRPSIDRNNIKIEVTGQAKTPDAFTNFQEALILSPRFADVYPGSETWYGERLGLQFDLRFRYMPQASLEEAVVEEAAAAEAGQAPATAAGGNGG